MRIASISSALPSRIVTNDEVLSLVDCASSFRTQAARAKLLRRARQHLGHCGSVQRRWLSESETPIDLMRRAAQEALEKAALTIEEIDLLVYAGIDRGFVEPGDSYYLAQALGATKTHCFDILDACNSWARAAMVIQAMMAAGMVRTVLLVNGEFYARKDGSPDRPAFSMSEASELKWRFPVLTLGEAASATVLQSYPTGAWRFACSSRPDLAHLCSVPLPGYANRCVPHPFIGKQGPLGLTSFGTSLLAAARREMPRLLRSLTIEVAAIAGVITHTATERAWRCGLDPFGLSDRLVSIFPMVGNIGAASIPVGLTHALNSGSVTPGDTVLCCTASAGMSFFAFTIPL